MKYTNYSFFVQAYTKPGDGVKSNPVYCRTEEDGIIQINIELKIKRINFS